MSLNKFLLLIFIFVKVEQIFSQQSSVPASYNKRGSTWPYDNITPFPYDTNGPMDLQTKYAKVLQLLPVTTVVQDEENILVKNTGNGVYVYPVTLPTNTYVTGGPLFNTKYYFAFIQIYWNNDYQVGCCGNIDGASDPLLVKIVFFNPEYGTLQNSLNHRNGVAIINVGFTVEGNKPNPNFTKFQNVLQKIVQAPASQVITRDVISQWLEYSSEYYFAVPSSLNYDDKAYYCVTSITPREKVAGNYISIDQFKVFQEMRNSKGAPISAVTTNFEQEPYVPLIQGSTVKIIRK